MEDNKKYKYGAHELDHDAYVKALRTNVKTFLEQDPSTRKWSKKDKEEFEQVYNLFIEGLTKDPGRFYTDDFGYMYDLLGKIQSSDASAKFAYYADLMAKGLLKHQNSMKPETKTEIPTFTEYLKIKHNVDKDTDLDFVKGDQDFFKENYNEYIKEYNISDENALAFQTAINKEGFVWDKASRILANKAGLDENIYNYFYNPPAQTSDYEIEKNNFLKALLTTFTEKYPDISSLYVGKYQGSLDEYYNDDKEFDYTSDALISLLNVDNFEELSDSQQAEAYTKLKNTMLTRLIEGDTSVNSALLLKLLEDSGNTVKQGKFIIIDPTSGDLPDSYLKTMIPNNALLVYNTETKQFEAHYIGNYKKILDKYILDWEIKNNYKTTVDYRKEGGTIRKLMTGGKSTLEEKIRTQKETKRLNLETKAKESGKSIEEYEWDLSEMTAGDIAFLSTQLGLDLISTVSSFFAGPGSIVSFGTGAASSLMLFGKDWHKDGLDWEDAGNLLANLGVDAIGLIPGVGTSGKIAKMAKIFSKISPWLLGSGLGLGIFSTIGQSEAIGNSFNKIIDGKGTKGDWENLYTLGRLLLSVGAYGGRKHGEYKTTQRARQSLSSDNPIGIPVKNKQGKNEVLTFTGNDSEEILQAIKDGNKSVIKSKIGDDYELNFGTNFVDFKKPEKWYNPLTMELNTGTAKQPWNYRITQSKNGTYYAVGKGFNSDIKNPTFKVSSEAEIDFMKPHQDKYNKAKAEYLKTKEELDAKLKELENIKIGNKGKAKSVGEIETVRKSPEFEANSKRLEEIEKLIVDLSDKSLNQQQKVILENLEKERKVLESYFVKYGANATPKVSTKKINLEVKNLEDKLNSLKTVDYGNVEESINGIPVNFKSLMDKYKIKYDVSSNKQGGILNVQNVRKFQSGGQYWRKNYNEKLNPRNINDWDQFHGKWDQIFNDDFKLNISSDDFLQAITNLNNIDTSNLFKGKKLNELGYKLWNEAYNKTGFNDLFGYNTDKADYLGPTTWNRKLALEQASKIYNVLNPLKTKDGSVYYDLLKGTWIKNNNTQYPMDVVTKVKSLQFGLSNHDLKNYDTDLSKAFQDKYNIETFNPANRAIFNIKSTRHGGNETEEKKENSSNNLLNNPLFTHALPRAMYADRVNKKLRDMAIANEKALLKDPFEYHRYVTGDFASLMQGKNNQAKLNNFASKAFISDADKQKSYLLEAQLKGLDYLNQGFNADNAAIKTSSEQAWTQGLENAKNRYVTTLENKQALMKADANRNMYKMAYENLKHEVWDTLWKQFESEALNKFNKTKNIQEKYDLAYLDNYIINNLETLDPDLTQDAINLYREINKGNKKLSDLSSDELETYNYVKNIISGLKYNQIGNYYGFSPTFNSSYQTTPTYRYHKNGGTIKERIANAERLYKTIKSDLDRNLKKLDRLFKNLYTLKNKK